MNLSEFAINLLLASFLILITLSFVSILEFHAVNLEQKINLEDTTLQALLSLEQSIHMSRVDYCTPLNKIINHTGVLNATSLFQWQDQQLTTYKLSPAIYLMKAPPSTVKSFTVAGNLEGNFLLTEDCEQAVLSTITATAHLNNQTTLTLNKALNVKLKTPVILSIVEMDHFDIDQQGLHRKINQDKRNLIYPGITAININGNLLSITAEAHNQHVFLQKSI